MRVRTGYRRFFTRPNDAQGYIRRHHARHSPQGGIWSACVDKLGVGASTLEPGKWLPLPITGGYAEFICLPQEELVPVPAGLDPAETLVMVFNYATAYQMMRRTARVKPGQRVLIHAAAGGIGTALLQLGGLVDLEMYGTASARKHELVSSLGATPIDYHNVDFAEEILRLTGDGVDVVFDGICSTDYLRRSFKSLRPGGRWSPTAGLLRYAVVD